MRGKALICLLVLCLLVGVVSADTWITETASTTSNLYQSALRNQTWDTLHDATSSTYSYSTTGYVGITSDVETNTWRTIYRYGMTYNTSGIPDDATINTIILTVRSQSTPRSIGVGVLDAYITDFTPASNTTNNGADFDQFGTTSYGTLSMANFTSGSTWYNYTLSSIPPSFDKTGYTRLGLRLSPDRNDNSSEATWAESAATRFNIGYLSSNPPKLYIDYTPAAGGDTTPPASISGLANSTLCSSINWTWTNPVDADFNHTMIYRDGAWLHNVSNTTTFDLWESLSELTEYAFASKTCDITGNCNATFVNQSATTTECIDTTPPASVSGLSNVTTCNQITWSWSNPTDPDFNHTVIYQNGTFLHNVSNATTTDVWSGLAELTEYIFSSYTCDITGNCNTTWQNLSSTTLQCGIDPPLASFISNTTCGNIPFAVLFNDTSLYTPTSWNWSFGDGGYSEDQNPVYTYSTAGLWSINFNATNDYGTNWSNVTGYIRAVPDWAACPATPTPTPAWTPVIMPSTEFDVNPWIFNWWWIGAIVVSMIVVFKKW